MNRIYLFRRWLDKLGIAALTNHTRVCRQTFVGGAYGLLDSDQYPLPVSDKRGEEKRERRAGKERRGEGRREGEGKRGEEKGGEGGGGEEEKGKGKRGKGEVRRLRWRERKGGRKGRKKNTQLQLFI